MKPEISVIITVFNLERWLEISLESCRAQSFSDFEAIVVMDGCTDNSLGIAEKIKAKDSRFRLQVLPENRGPGSARNEGLKLAQGDYIGFLDGDDYWEPQFLQKQLSLLQSRPPECVGVFSHSRVINPKGDFTGEIQNPLAKEYPFLVFFLSICPPANGSSLLLRRAPLLQAGQWLNSCSEDMDIWLKMLEACSKNYFLCNPEFLVRYRRREDSLSNDLDKVMEGYRDCIEKHLPVVPRNSRAMVLNAFASFVLRYGEKSYSSAARWATRSFFLNPWLIISSLNYKRLWLLILLRGPGYSAYLSLKALLRPFFRS